MWLFSVVELNGLCYITHWLRYRGHSRSTECAKAYRTLPFTQGRSTVFIAATNQNLKNSIVQRYLAANIFISLSWPVFFPLSTKANYPPKSICGLTVLAVRWCESEWQEEQAREREKEISPLLKIPWIFCAIFFSMSTYSEQGKLEQGILKGLSL